MKLNGNSSAPEVAMKLNELTSWVSTIGDAQLSWLISVNGIRCKTGPFRF